MYNFEIIKKCTNNLMYAAEELGAIARVIDVNIKELVEEGFDPSVVESYQERKNELSAIRDIVIEIAKESSDFETQMNCVYAPPELM